jgi:two-component system LytT family sensor kinase
MNVGALLNLVGLSMGVVLYAMLLVMVLRSAKASGPHARVDPLLLGTAILGLVWNVCALPVYLLPKMGVHGPFPTLSAVGFGALGFLPAVVVHSVVRGERDGFRGLTKRLLSTLAYGVSGFALALHVINAAMGQTVPSPLGMRLLTYTFVALAVPLAAITRGQPGSRRALWAAALAIFAVSALHLSQLHPGDVTWPIELMGHHASLPLAIAILYQDYPFALADLFLKRAVSLLGVVAVVFGAIAVFGLRSARFGAFVQFEPAQLAMLVTIWVATALLYPVLRQLAGWLVDTVILRRPDYTALRRSIGRTIQTQHDIPSLLSDLCRLVGPSLSAQAITWRERRRPSDDETSGSHVLTGSDAVTLAKATSDPQTNVATSDVDERAAVAVTIPTSDRPQYLLLVSGLRGGRRLLSDDVAALDAIAIVVARRIDAVRMTEERHERELREREVGKLATEAELRALRAQINPHFLFNALTTIGYLIQTAPPRALQTLLRLTALLRAVLRSEGELTTLGRELELIEAYLDIERARFEDRLRVSIEVPPRLRQVRVPPLVLQPLVENAIKHGIARKQVGGELTIHARIEDGDDERRQLVLVVQDSGAGASPDALERGRTGGVGLRNVERRLTFQYGPAASLVIRTAVDQGMTVAIRIPIPTKTPSERGADQVAV